jgi:hypothetical protein
MSESRFGIRLSFVGVMLVGILLVLGACFFLPLVSIWFNEARASRPDVYRPAAVALARLCQSDPPTFGPSHSPQGSLLIPDLLSTEIPDLGPVHAYAGPDGALVYWGGGPYHYGYRLVRDKVTSDATTNYWSLYCYNDNVSQHVYRFALPKSDRIQMSKYTDAVLLAYRRYTARQPYRQLVVGRIQFLLRHVGRDAAVQSIREFAERYPQDWLDTLLLFIMDSRHSPIPHARLSAWADCDPGCTSWLLAAHAYRAIGDDAAVLRSIDNALAKPGEQGMYNLEPADVGAPIGVWLYQRGSYDTCQALSRRLLHSRYAALRYSSELDALCALASRATDATSQPSTAPSLPKLPFEPFEGLDLSVLLQPVPSH